MSPKNQKEVPFSAQPDTSLRTDIVDNIPLHQAAVPVSEAENIDGIMKDVSREVKKVDETPKKHRLFGHKEKASPVAHQSSPTPASPAPPAATHVSGPRQSGPSAAKQKPGRSVPVMVIIYTVIVTAFLVVAAISAFKK